MRYMFLISPRAILSPLIICPAKSQYISALSRNNSDYEISNKTRGNHTLEPLHWNLQHNSSHDILHISEAHYAAVIFGSEKEYTRVAGV